MIENLPTIVSFKTYTQYLHKDTYYEVTFSNGKTYNGMCDLDKNPEVGMDILTFLFECNPGVYINHSRLVVGMEVSGTNVFFNEGFWKPLGFRHEVVKGRGYGGRTDFRNGDTCPEMPSDCYASWNYSYQDGVQYYPMRINIYKLENTAK